MALNVLCIGGNLVADPELRAVGDSQVCEFRIAHNRRFRGEEATDYYTVNVWGKFGGVCAEHLAKGRAVVVAGGLSVREYEANGEKRFSLEIRATEVQFIGGAKPSADGAATEPEGGSSAIPW